MSNIYHVLNGDMLKTQFPDIPGEKIILRECLVDGPIQADNLQALFALRSQFIAKSYGSGEPSEYMEKVASELEKIMRIPAGGEINLWFEDDLFCQVNFWFVLSLLSGRDLSLFLVRPDRLSPYGFGAYNQMELTQLLVKKEKLHSLELLNQLWPAYQADDIESLKHLSDRLREGFPFINDAVMAHIDRTPTAGYGGRPKESLLQIIRDLQSKEFGLVFQEFCRRESIYGFGDKQVKRLFDELVEEST